ncbi:MAG: RidA family protein [Ignavibacteriae bacterium]|nr:RidA family protein [Ignavibacteriota bacterium]MCB0750586.1 RidA family protein [Ignavibacteriota bacterium]MCB9247313.1 RidA family protein [Ignavibacteriales bacterium]
MVEEKLKELGILIPEAPKPLASYIPAIKVGNLVFTAGQITLLNGELKFKGKVGKDLTLEEGKEAAKLCIINCLSVIKAEIGSLGKIKRIVKVTAFVNSADGFTDQPKVANGASDLLVALFGEQGKHVRSAVGVNGLPIDASVEIEMIVEV